jgi:hypothetical protein
MAIYLCMTSAVRLHSVHAPQGHHGGADRRPRRPLAQNPLSPPLLPLHASMVEFRRSPDSSASSMSSLPAITQHLWRSPSSAW